MGYKPDVVQKAKFEYSPLGQVFNKGLEKDEKEAGLLKRLKNIEDKTGDQLKAIKNKDSQLGIESIGHIVKGELSQEAKNFLKKLSKQEKIINYKKIYLKGGDNSEYDFAEVFTILLSFLRGFITEKSQ